MYNLVEEINLLDMTRVPPEWYSVINAKIKEIIKTPSTLTELVKHPLFRNKRNSSANFQKKTFTFSKFLKIQRRLGEFSGRARRMVCLTNKL